MRNHLCFLIIKFVQYNTITEVSFAKGHLIRQPEPLRGEKNEERKSKRSTID